MPERVDLKIETLTVKEAVEQLRALGLSITPERLAAGIRQGVFPFGSAVQLSKMSVEIYKVLFEKWIQERVS